MIVKLPVVKSSYDQSVNIQLDGKVYTFRFKYNLTETSWYCYVGRIGADPKVKFKIINGMDLLAPWRAYEEIPQGLLFLVDNDLVHGRPGKDTFHTDGRFYLLYISLTEIE